MRRLLGNKNKRGKVANWKYPEDQWYSERRKSGVIHKITEIKTVSPCTTEVREKEAQQGYGCQDICHNKERRAKSDIGGSGCGNINVMSVKRWGTLGKRWSWGWKMMFAELLPTKRATSSQITKLAVYFQFWRIFSVTYSWKYQCFVSQPCPKNDDSYKVATNLANF